MRIEPLPVRRKVVVMRVRTVASTELCCRRIEPCKGAIIQPRVEPWGGAGPTFLITSPRRSTTFRRRGRTARSGCGVQRHSCPIPGSFLWEIAYVCHGPLRGSFLVAFARFGLMELAFRGNFLVKCRSDAVAGHSAWSSTPRSSPGPASVAGWSEPQIFCFSSAAFLPWAVASRPFSWRTVASFLESSALATSTFTSSSRAMNISDLLPSYRLVDVAEVFMGAALMVRVPAPDGLAFRCRAGAGVCCPVRPAGSWIAYSFMLTLTSGSVWIAEAEPD